MDRKIINTLLIIVSILLIIVDVLLIAWIFRNVINENGPFFTIIVTIIVGLLAAYLAFVYMRRQTKIMEQQAGIMERQIELTEKIDESSRIETMLAKYRALRGQRGQFWEISRRIYRDCRKQLEEPSGLDWPALFDEAIDNAGFPPGFNPDDVTNLFYSIKKLEPKWSNIPLWHYMTSLYHNDEDAEKSRLKGSRFTAEACECAADLAYFWNDWSYQLKEIGEHVQANPRELVVLTWIELALIRQVADTAARAGKTHLFLFAKTQWSLFVEERRDV